VTETLHAKADDISGCDLYPRHSNFNRSFQSRLSKAVRN